MECGYVPENVSNSSRREFNGVSPSSSESPSARIADVRHTREEEREPERDRTRVEGGAAPQTKARPVAPPA